jgi:hypothetical protein
MKKLAWCAIILLFGMSLSAIDQKDLDKIVDFSVTLKELYELVQNKNFAPASFAKYCIINGSVSSINIINPEEGNFLAELETVSGEWKNLDSVAMYKAFIYVQGKDFYQRVPSRKVKALPGLSIEPNRQVLVAGVLADIYVDEKGRRFPVVLASHLRILD